MGIVIRCFPVIECEREEALALMYVGQRAVFSHIVHGEMSQLTSDVAELVQLGDVDGKDGDLVEVGQMQPSQDGEVGAKEPVADE